MFTLSNFLLMISVLLVIGGAGQSLSREDRERMQQRAIRELPERSADTGTSAALRVVQRRGYIAFGIVLILFVAWCFLFGVQSLAIG